MAEHNPRADSHNFCSGREGLDIQACPRTWKNGVRISVMSEAVILSGGVSLWRY